MENGTEKQPLSPYYEFASKVSRGKWRKLGMVDEEIIAGIGKRDHDIACGSFRYGTTCNYNPRE